MPILSETKKPREYSRVVGLMSGTSLDGVDAACIEIDETQPNGAVRVVAFFTQPYSKETRALLFALCENGRIEDAARAHFALGEIFAEAVLSVLKKCNVAPRDVLCIGSHGQTISHLPLRAASEENQKAGLAPSSNRRDEVPDWKRAQAPLFRHSKTAASTRIVPSDYRGGATLQIGAPAVIAERTGIAVVSDFRSRDIAAGGQGAPLVPFADFRLLRSDATNRIVQNIGGIANLTWLPRAAKLDDVRAFDSGPGNMVIDECVRIFSKGAQNFDANGTLAASGKVDEEWLQHEMTHPFFATAPPKSTGREEFGARFRRALLRRRLVASTRAARHSRDCDRAVRAFDCRFLPRGFAARRNLSSDCWRRWRAQPNAAATSAKRTSRQLRRWRHAAHARRFRHFVRCERSRRVRAARARHDARCAVECAVGDRRQTRRRAGQHHFVKDEAARCVS